MARWNTCHNAEQSFREIRGTLETTTYISVHVATVHEGWLHYKKTTSTTTNRRRRGKTFVRLPSRVMILGCSAIHPRKANCVRTNTLLEGFPFKCSLAAMIKQTQQLQSKGFIKWKVEACWTLKKPLEHTCIGSYACSRAQGEPTSLYPPYSCSLE